MHEPEEAGGGAKGKRFTAKTIIMETQGAPTITVWQNTYITEPKEDERYDTRICARMQRPCRRPQGRGRDEAAAAAGALVFFFAPRRCACRARLRRRRR